MLHQSYDLNTNVTVMHALHAYIVTHTDIHQTQAIKGLGNSF